MGRQHVLQLVVLDIQGDHCMPLPPPSRSNSFHTRKNVEKDAARVPAERFIKLVSQIIGGSCASGDTNGLIVPKSTSPS